MIRVKVTAVPSGLGWFQIMRGTTVTLDVREDVRKGREPFFKILRTAYRLKPGQTLRLIAPFEPWVLFSVAAREGFSHQSRQTRTGDWEVLFQRVAIPEAIQESPASRPSPEAVAAKAENQAVRVL